VPAKDRAVAALAISPLLAGTYGVREWRTDERVALADPAGSGRHRHRRWTVATLRTAVPEREDDPVDAPPAG
jgi:hypothetical protein